MDNKQLKTKKGEIYSNKTANKIFFIDPIPSHLFNQTLLQHRFYFSNEHNTIFLFPCRTLKENIFN